MASNANIERRLRDLEQHVPPADYDPYRPEHVVVMLHTRAALHPVHGQEGAVSGQPRLTAEQKEQRDAIVQATVEEIVHWCAVEARRVDWRDLYYLHISFPHADEHPEYARFDVPWRRASVAMTLVQRGLGMLTGKGGGIIHWWDGGPVDGDPYADDEDTETAYQSMGLTPSEQHLEREELPRVAAVEPEPVRTPESVRTPAVQPAPARADNSAALQTLLRAYDRNEGGLFDGNWPF